MASVQFKHVFKKYPGGGEAVKDFTLDVEDEESVVLLGPRGSGKSSVLRIVAGIEDPTAGELLLSGQRANEIEARDREMAILPQIYRLYPHMSVYENMAFGLALRKSSTKEINERVHEIAKLLELEAVLHESPASLPAPLQHKVAIGRAAVRRPRVFLIDEMFSCMEAGVRAEMLLEMEKVRDYFRASVLYATQDQAEAMGLGKRIVVMRKGRIQQIGMPEEIRYAPANKFVAGYVGFPSINLIDAEAVEGQAEGNLTLRFGEQRFPLDGRLSAALRSQGYGGKPLVLGIRPEDMLPLGEAQDAPFPDASVLSGIVRAQDEGEEPDGLVRFDIGDTSWTALPEQCGGAEPGDMLRFALPFEKLYFFDVETGKRIG